MLNPFDVNDDVIFLFTSYEHHHKQISALILKPNVEVTSPTRYLCENFLSCNRSHRAYIYAWICE